MAAEKFAFVGGHRLFAAFGTSCCHSVYRLSENGYIDKTAMLITLFYIVVILYSVILHEMAHGLMALSMGDTTAKNAGRLTLNPIPHLDLVGSILLPLVTFFLGGFIFGYAKPVPYNPLNLNDQTYGPAKVALAGPLSNLMLAVLFGLMVRFVPHISSDFGELLRMIVRLNVGLAIFNLIPIPPLDGHWILFAFLPARYVEVKYFLMRYGIFFFLIFVFFLFPLLMPLINFLYGVIVGG